MTLQRAWFPDPQSLPFAPYIKTHALVSLVQKGLQYHEMESSLDKVCVSILNGSHALKEKKKIYFLFKFLN